MCESLSKTGKPERVDFEQTGPPTPYLADDDKDYDEDNRPKGQLQLIAATVIMNILYGAGMARHDLLHSCRIWACQITEWTNICDQRLVGIVAYILQNIDTSMFGCVGDKSADWRIWLFSDAGFAADKLTSKSVSGVFCAISGPTLYFVFCALSKKH